jgi:hypothetical protein
MASAEHLEELKKGVVSWNRWREQHPSYLDLRKANLINANLAGADLYGVDLSLARLGRANLAKADLRRSDLSQAGLYQATLTKAKLLDAKLLGTNLREADLRGANLSGAKLLATDLQRTQLNRINLTFASLAGVSLIEADLGNANFGATSLCRLDLRSVAGLETVRHSGPSFIGIETLYESRGMIPEVFLRGAGVPDAMIAYAKSLVANPIEYHTCFISYATPDQQFAERIYADLQVNGVRCWYAPQDLKIGQKFYDRIDESIHLHDRVLLILSRHSIKSSWVQREVTAAMEREDREKRQVLFPIQIDEAVTLSSKSWAADIRRQYLVGNFTSWKDHHSYQKSFARVLRDLRTDSTSSLDTPATESHG